MNLEMNKQGNDPADKPQTIAEIGWRQCSLFRPSKPDELLPSFLAFNPENEWLAICSQSCSVCSLNFEQDPFVEVIVGTELTSIDLKTPAARGTSVREIHFPVSGFGSAEGLSFKIARRAFIPRRLLLTEKLDTRNALIPQLRQFQGWLARYYTRIALPDELVVRLRSTKGVKETIKKALKKKLSDQKTPVHNDVLSFHITWSPDNEILGTESYEITILIACRSNEAQELLDRELSSLVSGKHEYPIKDGIIYDAPTVKLYDDITLADIDGTSVFTEWDDLSDLDEIADSLRSTPPMSNDG